MINNKKTDNPSENSNLIIVGEFALNTVTAELNSNTSSVKLEPLTLAFLNYLIKQQGQVVTREELLTNVWQNRVVSDDSIRKVVKKLREAFNDDAKSPKYIKTIPLQGYSLVADVSTTVNTPAKSSLKYYAFGMSLVVIACLIYTFAFVKPEIAKDTSNNTSAQPIIERLTNLSGSEIPGDYNKKLNRLVFLFRNNNNEPWQLHSKDMSSGLITRLTWDDASYNRALFSPDGKKIAYSRSEEKGEKSYIADFDPNRGISNEKLVGPNEKESDLLSWSSNGLDIYMSFYTEPEAKMSVHKVNVETGSLSQLTYPNVEGNGDYYAKESPDGKHLTVFRNIADRSYVMLILELPSMKITQQQALNFFASELVWHPNNRQFYISSFKGDFYHYTLSSKQLLEQAGSRPGINDVFYTCGANCFYMRQHDMNYSEIVEIQNPFSTGSPVPTLRLESTRAEFNPIYNKQATALFYTSKSDSEASLIRHSLEGSVEILHKFNPRHILTQLSLNAQEDHLIGKIEDRVFLLDLATKKFTYLTTALEIVNHPTWNRTGDAVYFSRIEQHHPVLLKYDLLTDNLTRVEQGITKRLELTDGRIFSVNTKDELYKLEENGDRSFIIKLPSTYSDHWQVHHNDLYFSSIENNTLYLNKLSLVSGEHQIKLISKNNWQGNFYIHPNSQKLLTTQSVIGNSNLVKLHWPINKGP